MVSPRRVRDAAEVVVLEPVGVAFEGDDVGVVDEAVDHRGGHGVVAEDFAPAAELLVAGDDERGLLGLVEVVRGQDDRRPAVGEESMRPQNSRRACGRNRLSVRRERAGRDGRGYPAQRPGDAAGRRRGGVTGSGASH
jgi:hypothetical protein